LFIFHLLFDFAAAKVRKISIILEILRKILSDFYSTENHFSRGYNHFSAGSEIFSAGSKNFVAGSKNISAGENFNKSRHKFNLTGYGRTTFISAK
jgi:hypothetical protein